MIGLITVYPDFNNKMGNTVVTGRNVTVDGNVITGKGLGVTIPFALELVTRLINKEKADSVRQAICYE